MGPVLWAGMLDMIRQQKHAGCQWSSLCFLTVQVANGQKLLLSLQRQTLVPRTVSPNKPFIPQLLLVRYLFPALRKLTNAWNLVRLAGLLSLVAFRQAI